MIGGNLAERIDEGLSQWLSPAQRRRLFALLVLALMLVLCAPLYRDQIARDAPDVSNGEISYRAWGPLSAPVKLDGSWRLRWIAGAPDIPAGTDFIAPVPGNWQGLTLPDGRALPKTGVASFAMTISDLPAGRYILHIPIIFGANRVWVDGKLVGSRGVMGTTAATTVYSVRSHEIPIETDGGPLTIRVDIAAFHHRDTGFGDPPIFGLAEPMRDWIAGEWAKDFLFQTSLLLLAAMTLVGFLFRRQDRASLYLALTALAAIPGGAVLSYDNLLLLALPNLSYSAMLVLQYVCSNLALGFFMTFARALFPAECPRWLYVGVIGVVAAHIAAEIIAFAVWGNRAASIVTIVWPVVLVAVFLGIIFVVARASMRGRDGASVLLIGTAGFSFFFFNAGLAWSGLVPPDFLFGATSVSFGLLMLLFSQFIVIAERWSLAIIAAERTSNELGELLAVSSSITSEIHLEALLGRIVEVTSRMLSADRCTLLLHDAKTGELWSLVAEGLGSRQLRFPSTAGLAGHVFTTGTMLNVADAYTDPRFSDAIDVATGYRTRSLLTMPIVARDGRRLGVIQALNRRDARSFSKGDADRMAALAAQAAIAIDNATLFTEVIEARNYDESILRSMSNGVVTLDRDAAIGKLNEAARRILGLPETGLEGADVRALLAENSPWLIDEIDGVLATGEPKLLLDIDMRNASDETVALNLSIVPLRNEEEMVGVLVLIEDISEGKRMQGAMRRFMTQKVVDQVLGRGDELMFGTSCTASVLFADIRNFTSMAEALTARETVDMLNEAFTDFVEAVVAQDGVLDKFIGDAIMAVYGAPLSSGQDALNAVESGAQMLRMLGELNQRRSARSLPPLRLGVGIATGEVVAGTIGSPKRMDYTVIGDSVNLASRLQDLTKPYGVEMLVCETTAALTAGRYTMRELDLILVRGRQRPAKIFQVFPAQAAQPPAALLDAYQCGRACLARHDMAGAVSAFEEAAALGPADQPALIMLDRAKALAANPPGSDWDGVWRGAGAH